MEESKQNETFYCHCWFKCCTEKNLALQPISFFSLFYSSICQLYNCQKLCFVMGICNFSKIFSIKNYYFYYKNLNVNGIFFKASVVRYYYYFFFLLTYAIYFRIFALKVNINSLQLLIVRLIESSRCLVYIVQCNCMRLSQLSIGPLLSSVQHTLDDIATNMSPHTYLCQLCVSPALQRR